jgi:plasmid maintenance system antidote protein VapI
MTEQQKQEIIQELKDYIDSILKPIDNDEVFPLKDLMSDYHITRARLAHELGVSKETISLWINNKRIIPDEYAELLHKFFEYQLELDH